MDERLKSMTETAAERKPSSFLECEMKVWFSSLVNNVTRSKPFCLEVILLCVSDL